MSKPSIAEVLKPLDMTCADCGSKMLVYPNESTGNGYCPKCSPTWLKSFAIFQMNEMRKRFGLEEYKED